MFNFDLFKPHIKNIDLRTIISIYASRAILEMRGIEWHNMEEKAQIPIIRHSCQEGLS